MIKTNEYGMPLNFVKAVRAIQNRDQQLILLPGQPGAGVKCFTATFWNRQTALYNAHPTLMQDAGGYWAFVEYIPEPQPGDVLSHEPTGGAELKAVKEAKAAAEASKPKKEKTQTTIE